MPAAEQVTLTRLTLLCTVEDHIVTTDTVCTYSSHGIYQLQARTIHIKYVCYTYPYLRVFYVLCFLLGNSPASEF